MSMISFGTAGKFLSDNGSELDNDDFRGMCESFRGPPSKLGIGEPRVTK